MKKLIVAVAVVCTVAFANAAVANWKASASGMYNGTGSTADSALYSGSAYIFDASVMSQAALYAIIEAGASIDTSTSGYVASAMFEEGAFGGVTFANGEQGGGSYTYYFVVLNGDKAYFSNEKSVKANGNTTAKSIGFSGQAGSSALPTGTGFQGAGTWSNVPEPTSAMLLVLGVAALALRRKQK